MVSVRVKAYYKWREEGGDEGGEEAWERRMRGVGRDIEGTDCQYERWEVETGCRGL